MEGVLCGWNYYTCMITLTQKMEKGKREEDQKSSTKEKTKWKRVDSKRRGMRKRAIKSCIVLRKTDCS